MKTITNGRKRIIRLLILFIAFYSCNETLNRNEFNVKYVKLKNYKYVSAPFTSDAGAFILLEIKNNGIDDVIIDTGFGNFYFAHKNDTLFLGSQIDRRNFSIEKNKFLGFEFTSPIRRDLERYNDVIDIIQYGELFYEKESIIIPITKSEDFHIDEGGKEGDAEWDD